MDISTYSDQRIKEIVSKLLNINVEVEPIGNHELKRHLVYSVKNDKDIVGNWRGTWENTQFKNFQLLWRLG